MEEENTLQLLIILWIEQIILFFADSFGFFGGGEYKIWKKSLLHYFTEKKIKIPE